MSSSAASSARRHTRSILLLLPASVLLLLLISRAPKPASARRAPERKRRRILSLGGNGMIGTSVLARLLSTGLYDITVVSRGSWPFDASSVVAPFVTHVRCDRSLRTECPEESEDPEGYEWCEESAWLRCPDLLRSVADVEEEDESYWAVLDFSGYTGEWVLDAVEALGDMVRVYVYVSTDSVYEVSQGAPASSSPSGYARTGRRTTELQAHRPTLQSEQNRLNGLDGYGHRKLEGEEVLYWQRQEEEADNGEMWDGFPYVILRFADVLGPRDNTDRYVPYHMWVKYADRVKGIPPLHIREDVVEATSVTYVEDAARAIVSAMEREDSWDEAYNIACEEVFNATEFIITLGRIMGKDGLTVEKRPPSQSFALFPSVKRGPISIDKARRRIDFAPTPLETALEETVEWYDRMLLEDENIREDMVEEFIGDVLDENKDDYEEVVGRLWAAVNEDVARAKEDGERFRGGMKGDDDDDDEGKHEDEEDDEGEEEQEEEGDEDEEEEQEDEDDEDEEEEQEEEGERKARDEEEL